MGVGKEVGARGASEARARKFALKQHVFLVGFMGAGKTTVSRRLSRMCGLSSIDLDSYIERMSDMPIKDIFAQSGEQGFRQIETQALLDIASKDDPMIVSCGGGILTVPRNIEIMKAAGLIVHLRVDVDEASLRISDASTRPLFQDLEAARERLEERMPVYEAESDIAIDTFGKNVGAVAYELRRQLLQSGVLVQTP